MPCVRRPSTSDGGTEVAKHLAKARLFQTVELGGPARLHGNHRMRDKNDDAKGANSSHRVGNHSFRPFGYA